MTPRFRHKLVALGLVALAATAWAAGKAPVVRRYDAQKPRLGDQAIVHIRQDGQQYDHVSLQQYKDLRNATVALMRKYPPDTHVYVGLGRDPAPFIAFLQEIGADAYNFPASGSGHSASANLDRHFDRLIPASVRNGGKTIVLIDQTRSGKTHQTMMPLLKDYLRRTGSSVRVRGVAFNQSPSVSLSVPGLDVIDTTPFPEVFQFFYPPYEGVVSPFERHAPSTDRLSDLKMRSQYDRYRSGLGQRIERDVELDRVLARWSPTTPSPAVQQQRRSAPSVYQSGGGKPTREAAWSLQSPFSPGLGALGTGATLTLDRKKQTYRLLGKAQYDELRWGTTELLRRHPPSKGRVYVGVGRSSSPIVAFLENLGASNVSYLPADGLKNEAGVTAQLEADFQPYFAKFIPRQALARGDTITLFQQSDTGKTLTALKPMLERYIRNQGSTSRVELVAFSTRQLPASVSRIDTRGQQALQELNGDAFKTAAHFTYHRVGEDKISDLRRPRGDYGQFKQALYDRMQRDQALDDFLQKSE